MLFDVKQFEQVFKETTLKKGLKLFEKGELEFVERLAGFEYHFLVSGEDVYLKKKGDKLIQYSCSCGKNEYCGHLSAVMFYFQQEALGISVKKKSAAKKSGKGRPVKNNSLENNLKKAETESLAKFIKGHKYELSPDEVFSFLKSKTTLSFFDLYWVQVGLLFEPYLHYKKIGQKQVEEIRKELSSFIKKTKQLYKIKESEYDLCLAIVCAYFPLFGLRFTGDEKPLFEFYRQALKALDDFYQKGLDKDQKKKWFKATLRSVESNKNLHSEAYVFFVPRFVSDSKSEKDLAELNFMLSKRVYKIPYNVQLDKLLMVRLEVALREWKLFETAFSLHHEGIEIELILAKAELYFCKNKADKAFQLLEKEYENVRTLHKIYYNDYLDYILSNARRVHDSSMEIKFLRESFVRKLFIVPEDLQRFISLIPEGERQSGTLELIKILKTNTNGYYFDKISLLLLEANLTDELIRELSKQNNKFTLMHEIALRKFPDYNDSFLTLYMRHLSETLKQDSIYSYQVKVFNVAKVFLDKLPEKLVIELIKKLLDQVGKTGHLYRYINEMYNYPFLVERENY